MHYLIGEREPKFEPMVSHEQEVVPHQHWYDRWDIYFQLTPLNSKQPITAAICQKNHPSTHDKHIHQHLQHQVPNHDQHPTGWCAWGLSTRTQLMRMTIISRLYVPNQFCTTISCLALITSIEIREIPFQHRLGPHIPPIIIVWGYNCTPHPISKQETGNQQIPEKKKKDDKSIIQSML